MINSITDGIVAAINACFGDDKPIYTENVEQKLVEPCFLIQCVSPSERQVLGNRYFRQNLFAIYYFPSENGGNAECNTVFESLLSSLEYITVDTGTLRGTGMTGRTEDGVLVFNVYYNLYIHKTGDNETKMTDLTVKGMTLHEEG